MKNVFYLFVLLFLTDCTSRAITKVERAIIESRTYSRQLRFKKQIIRESTFRRAFFEVLKSKYQIDAESRQDTLILVEYFDNICANCNFDEIALLAGRTAYIVRHIDPETRFFQDSVIVDTVRFETHSHLIGNGLWKLTVSKNQSNPFDPKLYSSPCDDGGNANITWILPSLDCRSINANCFL